MTKNHRFLLTGLVSLVVVAVVAISKSSSAENPTIGPDHDDSLTEAVVMANPPPLDPIPVEANVTEPSSLQSKKEQKVIRK